MAGSIKNCFLVNAPAGSGKTTKIKSMIKEYTLLYPKDNILCITYTNRAVDELLTDISSSHVFISTIHSFLNQLISPYFTHKEVLELYFERYSKEIEERINSTKPNILDSNNRYKEKHGEFSYDAIRNNLNQLYYNELEFSSFFYGGLSHNDLISFSKLMVDKFPIIKKRITSKYQLIFIDEYQDTSADVLKLFYDSIINTRTKLYLFGDRMQQIYQNYNGAFEKELTMFDKSEALNINRRSSATIINLLNNIYNDDDYKQEPQEDRKDNFKDIAPRLIICDDMEKELSSLTENEKDILVLYLLNSKRFSSIGAGNLYTYFNRMERYSYGKKDRVVSVLTSSHEDNPDALMKLLFLVINCYDHYNNNNYGPLIQEVKKYPKIFRKVLWELKTHQDKVELDNKLKSIFFILEKGGSIDELLTELAENAIIKKDYFDVIKEDSEYETVFNVSISEVMALYFYLKLPKISTQHGVKGESHNNVIFVADDSSNLSVKMYDFFKLWSKVDLSLIQLQNTYYSYLACISQLEQQLKIKISDLNAELFKNSKLSLIATAQEIKKQFDKNAIFNEIYSEKYHDFLANPNVTKAKECFKTSLLANIFNAYKLFYVGCSRARSKLVILLDKNKIDAKTLEIQKEKFKRIGFDIK